MKKSRSVGVLLLGLGVGMGQAHGAGFLSADVLERAYQAHLGFDGLGDTSPDVVSPQPLGTIFLTTGYRSRSEILGTSVFRWTRCLPESADATP